MIKIECLRGNIHYNYLRGVLCRFKSSLDCNRRLGFGADSAFKSQFLPCKEKTKWLSYRLLRSLWWVDSHQEVPSGWAHMLLRTCCAQRLLWGILPLSAAGWVISTSSLSSLFHYHTEGVSCICLADAENSEIERNCQVSPVLSKGSSQYTLQDYHEIWGTSPQEHKLTRRTSLQSHKPKKI